MTPAPTLRSHALSLAVVPSQHEGRWPVRSASAALLWIDRPFAVTAAHVVDECLALLDADPAAEVWLGCLRVPDLRERLLCRCARHDLATIRVEPEELVHLGDACAFHNPTAWPPEAVAPGDEIVVHGYPRDQWPAQVEFRFAVESAVDRRFTAMLRSARMPGRLAGLCGAPAFRRRGAEVAFVGVVTETLFHNELIRCQHARHVDTCGQVTGSSAA